MTPFPRIEVDLRAPADTRWRALAPHAASARAMVEQYLGELVRLVRDEPILLGMMVASERAAVPAPLGAEISGIAALLGVPRDRVLAANLYYDAFRVLMGCTAFAVDRPEGPLHARNLDWWTEDRLLTRATLLTDFVGAPAGPFTTIGWPGLVGCFSGVARGRFAVTLNAVLSDEKPTLALSTTMLLRDVLEHARGYAEARQRLSSTPIASDCLLLLTGAARGELCVIERTSTRHAIREAEDGLVAVTNDYRSLDAVQAASGSVLQATACGRFERALERAARERPVTPAAALDILRDRNVQMGITVQQMVLEAATGRAEVVAPG